MRKLLALALLVLSTLLIPSTASAHHRDFDGVRIYEWDIHCIKFYDVPGGPVSWYAFEGGVNVSEFRADVWAIRVMWRLYDSKTGELYQEKGRRFETDAAQEPVESFGPSLQADPEPLDTRSQRSNGSAMECETSSTAGSSVGTIPTSANSELLRRDGLDLRRMDGSLSLVPLLAAGLGQ